MSDYPIYLLLKGTAWLIRLLPHSAAMKLGEGIGRLLYIVDKRHRQVAYQNLQMVWGKEKTPEQLTEITRSCFINLGCSLVEFCRFPGLNEQNMQQMVEVEGLEHFERAWQQGKGILAVTAHFGNWELLAATMAMRGYPSNIVIRPLDNPYVDKLVSAHRTRFGNRIIPKKRALPEVLRCLKQGKCVAILMDQSTAPREAVLATFFGHQCYTLVTPAMLALKTGCALIPLFITRQQGGKHKLTVAPEVVPVRSDDRQQDLQVNTQRLNDIIEDYVRKHPEQWLWIHRRWRV